MDPGSATTVQDLGRHGWGDVGVSPSGVFDRAAGAAANRLVGNHAGAAVLEALGGGLRLRTSTTVIVAATGASGPVTVSGSSAARNSTVVLPAGEELRIEFPTGGARTYLAVRGGIAVSAVLASRSWDSLGRLGPPPLSAGDVLPIGPAADRLPPIDHIPVAPRTGPLTMAPGPRRDWFTDDAWDTLISSDYTVSADSDRAGVRLSGPVLVRSRAGELPPEGLVRGAIQVPPDGQPIVMGPDHPPTGGYPVIGVLSPSASDRCAQLLPGDRVRLSAILVAGR